VENQHQAFQLIILAENGVFDRAISEEVKILFVRDLASRESTGSGE